HAMGLQGGWPLHVFVWKISPPIKGLLTRHQKNMQWPATLQAHCMYGIHIYVIQVRPFFTVYFNTDKMLIHQLCRLQILKTFLFHNMTPMAGGIAYTHQYRFIFLLGPCERLFPPRIPIYRIVGML